jgi:hypothetical protein
VQIVIAVDPQVGFDSSPSLFQIVFGLVFKDRGQFLAEENRDTNQQQREDSRVNRCQREPETARDVLAFSQIALWRLLYRNLLSQGRDRAER